MIQTIKQLKSVAIILFALLVCAGAHGQSANAKKSVKHIWKSDEYAVIFFNNGTVRLASEWQENMNIEKLKPNAAYKEYPTRLLVEDAREMQLFDDFGHIAFTNPGWEVINYHRVYSRYQITNLITDLSKVNGGSGPGQFDNIKQIKNTCLILLPFKEQHFEDEDSDEAQAYFTMADDWGWYVSQTKTKFEEMGIENIQLTRDEEEENSRLFLSFELYDGNTIFVNTQEEQNGAVYTALLYRKGYIPIIIDIVGSDEQNEQIENYLSESGEGGPPFERWRTANFENEQRDTSSIPAGYRIFEKIEGDLNRDGKDDYVLIIKGTDKNRFEHDENRGELDRNRRGIMIFFNDGDNYKLELENRSCFASENEDGGVYFAPELSVKLERGNLYIRYDHGRYGWWRYTFRYRNSEFELIGYDASEPRGPYNAIVGKEVSINFSTKRMLTKININENDEGGDEKFQESWKSIAIGNLIKLSEISDFDELQVQYIYKL